MCEYVGMPYFAVLKHAFRPAVISYIALLYLEHLEAMKADMPVLPKPGGRKPLPMTLLTSGITIASILILCGLVYYAVIAFQALFGVASGWLLALLVFAVYVALAAHAARRPDITLTAPDQPVLPMPNPNPT